MLASQKAKEKCANKQNKPAKNTEAENCCCMVAPWQIKEQGREEYILKVTKVETGKGLNGAKPDVSKKLEPSNKENKRYELHIVAPPADKNGNVTFKKITSNHKFLKKECDLKMLVKSGNIEKTISEGGSFEIDTNAQIKGGRPTSCEQQTESDIRKKKASEKHHQKHQTSQKAYEDSIKNFETSVSKEEQTPRNREAYMKFAEEARDRQMRAWQKELEAEIERIDNEYEKSEESDLVVLFKVFSDPNSVAKEISLTATGSKKCISQPEVNLIVLSPLSINGEVTIGYTPQHTVHEYTKKSWDAIANAQLAIQGKVSVKYGTSSIEYSNAVNFGGNEDGDPTYRKVRRKDAKKLFSGIHYPINEFYKCFASNPHSPKLGSVSFSAGTTELRFKADKITLIENQYDYTTGWTGSFEIGVTLFKGMNVKVDVINAILSRGSDKIAVLVEEVREKVKEGYRGKYFEIGGLVEAFLIVDGEIDGFIKWEKTAPNKPVVPSGTISGRVGVAIEGKIEADSRVFELRARGGVQMKTASAGDDSKSSSIEATMSAKVGSKGTMDFDGDVRFTGLEIFYGYYAEVNKHKDIATNIQQSSNNSEFPQVDNTRVVSLSKGTKLESKGSLLLIKDFSFGELLFGKEGTKNETN